MSRTDVEIKSEATRLRKRADALLVLVITSDYCFYSDDPRLSPEEAYRVMREEAEGIATHMRANRKKAGRG